MKKLISTIIATLSIAPIFATQYFGFDLGTNYPVLTKESDTGLKTGVNTGARYGYCFDSGIRAEAHIIYRNNNFKTIYKLADKDQVSSKEHNSIHSWSYMINLIYDIKPMATSDILPYLGIGVGYCANTQTNSVKFDDHKVKDKLKDSRFAYHGIIGLKYGLQENLVTSLEYRYFTGHSHKKDHSLGISLTRMF